MTQKQTPQQRAVEKIAAEDAKLAKWLSRKKPMPKPEKKRRRKSKRQRAKVALRIRAKIKAKHPYYTYIRSKAWKTRRKRAIADAGGKCNRCGSTEDLRVHHLTYERLGHELLKDLEVLCVGCHDEHHRRYAPREPEELRVPKF